MINNFSRRHWLKYLSAGMSGLLLSEQNAKASDASDTHRSTQSWLKLLLAIP